MSGARTRIHLCGRLAFELDGERREAALRGRQGRLLFAYLVLHRGRAVARDELVEAVSADGTFAVSGASLAPLLSRLRRAIAPGTVEGRDQLTLALPEPVLVDWEEAREALARARAGEDAWTAAGEAAAIAAGGLLPGLEAGWLEPLRAELAGLRVEALEARAAAGLVLGGAELAGAEEAARAAVAAEPFRESASLALMRVLHARGNVAEALRVFDELRTLLREELGTAPGAALLALHEELVCLEAAPRPQPLAETASRDLEERGAELARLDAALARRAGLIVLEGPAGVGKSRLLAELRRRAPAAELRVLGARAAVLEREFPFGVVRQLFEDATEEEGFAGGAAAARPVFAAGDAEDPSFAVLHGLFRLACNLSPVVLVVDDLHWCDRASLRFLAYLARRLDDAGVLLAVSIRTGEPAVDDALLAEVAHDPLAVEMHPQPLSAGAVGRLVVEHLGVQPDAAFAAACHEATGGNPLLVHHLLVAVASERIRPDAAGAAAVRELGAAALSRTILARLRRLPEDSLAVARAVAILGDHAELPATAELAGLDERHAAVAVGALARAEILRGEPPLGFVHPLVRDAVYGDIAGAEREVEHGRAAAILARHGDPEHAATHLLLSPRRGDAAVVAQLRAAARAAAARGALDSGVAYLERALAEPPPDAERAELLYELGAAQTNTNGPLATERLRAAVEAAADPGLRGRAAFLLARTLLFVGAAPEGAALAARTRAELPDDLADLRLALRALEGASASFGGADVEALAGVEAVPVDGPGAAMFTAWAAFTTTVTGGPATTAVAYARESLTDELLRADNGLFWVGAAVALLLGDAPDAMAAWERASDAAHRSGSAFLMLSVHLWRGFSRLRRGEPAEAERDLRRHLEEWQLWIPEHGPTIAYVAAFLAEARLEQNDLPGAWQLLLMAEPPRGADSGQFWRCARARLLNAEGRHDEALAATDDVAEAAGPVIHPLWVPWRAQKAYALDALGRHGEAVALAREDLEIARATGAPGVVGRAMRVLGGLERDATRLRDAAGLLADTAARLEHAEALAALGAVLDGPESAWKLREALALAEELGAERLAAEIRPTVDSDDYRERQARR